MKRGVIVEKNERLLTMLTPNGEFLQAKNQHGNYEVGQEIDFVPIKQKQSLSAHILSLFMIYKTPALIVVMLMVIFSTISIITNENEVYAYMSIDINPSIEMAVDKNLQVVALHPYNEDGKRIVKDLDNWKHQLVTEVINKIILESDRQGFLADEKQVFVATVPHAKRQHNIDEKLTDELQTLKTSVGKKLAMTIVEGTEEQRDDALKNGVTTGTYLQKNQGLTNKQLNNDEKQLRVKKAAPGQSKQQQEDNAEQPKSNNDRKQKQSKQKPGKINKQPEHQLSPNQDKLPLGQVKKLERNKNKQDNKVKKEKQQLNKNDNSVRSSQKGNQQNKYNSGKNNGQGKHNQQNGKEQKRSIDKK